MTNENCLTIRDRTTIISKLLTLIDNKCPITAKLGKHESLLTSIIGINVETGTLILAHGDSEKLNKQMITLPYVEFNAVFRNTHVAFSGATLKKVTYKGKTAFMMYIPGSLYWCNRRQHHRMKIPMNNANFCFCEIVLSAPDKNASDEYKQHYINATNKIRTQLLDKTERERNNTSKQEILINLIRLGLYDISQSGCAILNHDEAYSYFLAQNAIYENCKIIMPNDDEITVSFQIMSRRNIEICEAQNTNSFNELVGVKFLKIIRNNVAAQI